MRPIRLHLDTSDYAVMYRAEPGSEMGEVRDQLKAMVRRGVIEIGLSYHVFFELMRKAEPEYQEDRLQRGRLLTDLCGRNAFPYPTDLGQGESFSTEGLWVPHIDLDEIEIERVVHLTIESMARSPEITRHEMKVLSKRKYLIRWAASNPTRFMHLVSTAWPLKFSATFAEDGNLTRYLSGELTRSEANSKLQFHITDPMTAYDVWFGSYRRDDPIWRRRDNIASGLTEMLRQLSSTLDEVADLERRVKDLLAGRGENALDPEEREALATLRKELKTFRVEMSSPEDLCEQVPRWKELFGDAAALMAAQILFAYHREKRAIKQSDGIDFVHAMYLPYCDLWRGDKAFSDLLIKHRVKFSERVVPSLRSVLERIEGEIRLRSASLA